MVAKPNKRKRSKRSNRTVNPQAFVRTAISSNIAVFFYMIYRALKLQYRPALDEAVAVGDIILTHINGTTPAEYTFQKKNQVVILGLQAYFVKTTYTYTILIDLLLLFQRLKTVM